jgi:hypothetical protein
VGVGRAEEALLEQGPLMYFFDSVKTLQVEGAQYIDQKPSGRLLSSPGRIRA